MFDLDLSIKDSVVLGSDEVIQVVTEEDALMESLFDEPGSGSKRAAPVCIEDEERKRLRALIDAAFEESEPCHPTKPKTPDPPALVQEESRNDMREMCKNAGIFREFGGVKGWLAMQRSAPSGSQNASVDVAR